MSEDRIAVIVNPASASGSTGRRWKQIADGLSSAGITFESWFTTAPEDATRLARLACLAGFTRVVAVGGDGTLNEVVNGLLDASGQPLNDVALGLLSCGTGDDFARGNGVRGDIGRMIRAISAGSRRVDIGQVTFQDASQQQANRFFINVADMGLGGDVATRINAMSKHLGARPAFIYAAVRSLISYRNKPLRLCVDDGPWEETTCKLVAVANGSYFGGGMMIAPLSQPDDGWFDVVIAGDLSFAESLTAMPRLYSGTHLALPKVRCLRARSVRIEAPEAMVLELDGEPVGHGPVHFQLLASRLKLLTDRLS